MANLDDVKSALLAQENGEQLYEAVTGAIAAEKERGIQSTKKVKSEIDGLKKYKSAVNDLGFDGTVELTDFVSGLSGKMKGAEKDTSELSQLRTTVNTLQSRFDDSQKKLSESEEKRRSSMIMGKLMSDFKGKVFSEQANAKVLLSEGHVTLNDADEVVWNTADGQVSYDDGLKSFLDKNPDIVRNSQNGGGGSKPSNGNANSKTMALSEFNKLSGKERLAFMASGGATTKG